MGCNFWVKRIISKKAKWKETVDKIELTYDFLIRLPLLYVYFLFSIPASECRCKV